jgi:IPT/TIG domain/Viral BACON domain
MTKIALRFLLSLVALTVGRTALHAQTFTYHVHQEASTRVGMMQLKSSGPDTAVKLWTAAPQVGLIQTIRVFDLPANVPDLGGVIPKGTTVTFTLWMRITAARGTVYPAATLRVNWPSDAPSQELCAAQGSTPLTTTLAPYTFSCTLSSPLVTVPTDRLTFVPEFYTSSYTPAKGKNGGMSIEFGAEGTLNGTADSQIAIVVPPDPRISSVTPTSGSSGTLVTINGHNFGSTQGSSRFTISGLDVTPQTWSPTQITAQIPDGVNHGPIQVTVDSLTSNTWMFIGVWDDAQCQVKLTPSKLRIIVANGGSTTLNVTADPGCAWSIQGLPGWLSAAQLTGTGNSNVLLSATANAGNDARTGTLSVNSVPAAVLQNGRLGAPLFWIKTLAPPTVTLSSGTARCVLDLDNESTATPAFVGLALYFSNQRIASTWNAGDVFTLEASAPATPGSGSLLSCSVFAIDEGFVVAEGPVQGSPQ